MKEGALPELPGGWAWTSIGDIGENNKYAIVDGPFGSHLKISDYIENGEIPVISITNIDEGFDDDKLRYISREKFETIKRSAVKPGDIIVAKIGSSYGKCGFYPEWMPTGIIPANLVKITASKLIDKLFVFYYLKSLAFKKKLDSITKSTAQPAFNVSAFRSLSIPLPPLPEQRAIVSKIEQLFSDLDNGIEYFKKSQAQLKLYRQSVLKAACEGKLVPTEAELARAEGRKYEAADVLLARILKERRSASEKNGKDAQYKVRDTSGLPGLPEGWCWVESNIICKTITDGDHQPPPQSEEGIPFLVISNIKEGKLDFSKTRFVPEYYYQSIQKHRIPKKGDILYSVVGSYGIPAMVDVDRNFCFQRHIALLKPSEFIYNKYLLLALKSDFTFRQATAFATGTAQLTVSLSDLRQIKIPLPPLAEQRRIVAEAERCLSVSDKMEATIAESLLKAESLRQSILKKAFEGKLLNEKELEKARNAPDWEPAEKLLERIRAEKKNLKTKE